MAEITLGENVWKDFVAAAKKIRKKPERLAEHVLRDYLARAADKELLEQTARAARRKGTSIAEAEAAIKELRRESRP
jgi:hypothetical protein